MVHHKTAILKTTTSVTASAHHHLRKADGVILHQTLELTAARLQRTVTLECFVPALPPSASMSLLLLNDGQHMQELNLMGMLQTLVEAGAIAPLLCVAIHAGDRMMEFGTAHQADFKQRGARAGAYADFIFKELLPFIHSAYPDTTFTEKAFAGFSLGGLSALDIVWNHPDVFSRAGVFSGSLWWRSKDISDGYQEDTHRIMHAQVRQGKYAPSLKFFFEAGTLDETADRNHNGIIDSIDDTLALVTELQRKGYPNHHIAYLELPDGRHDIATWAKAMPAFLTWGWGK